MKPKAYIAGKISGLKLHEVTMRFGAVQRKLEDRGYAVINPLELQNDLKADWRTCMLNCIPALITCDCVFMLPDWEDSKGARLEHHIAVELGIEITYL